MHAYIYAPKLAHDNKSTMASRHPSVSTMCGTPDGCDAILRKNMTADAWDAMELYICIYVCICVCMRMCVCIYACVCVSVCEDMLGKNMNAHA